MPLRATNFTKTAGYGVFGDVFTLQSPDFPTAGGILLNTRTELGKIPIDTNRDIPSYRVISMMWRFSVDVLDVDMSAVKQYDNKSGKSQYGSWVAKGYDYTTTDGFISYDRVLSPRFVYTFYLPLDASDEPDDYIPCSEPQGNFPDLFTETELIFAASRSPTFFVNAGFLHEHIADKAELYFGAGVLTVRAGVTYAYQAFDLYLENQEYEGLPRIVLL